MHDAIHSSICSERSGRLVNESVKIRMSVDKVLAMAKTVTIIQIKMPLNKNVYTKTILMARHQRIAKLFDEDFWVTQ